MSDLLENTLNFTVRRNTCRIGATGATEWLAGEIGAAIRDVGHPANSGDVSTVAARVLTSPILPMRGQRRKLRPIPFAHELRLLQLLRANSLLVFC